MKLRTKLTLGCLCLMSLALCICCAFTVQTSRSILLSDAIEYTVDENKRLTRDFYAQASAAEAKADDAYMETVLRYCFSSLSVKSSQGSEYVLQGEEGEIFNNSGINAAEMLKNHQAMRDEDWESISYCLGRLNGRDFCIAGQGMALEGRKYTVSVVRDITESMEKIRRLTAGCIGICVAVIFLTGVFTVLFLRRALAPIEKLQRSAEAIAAGDYESRIELTSRDELGKLAEHFNQMAESVQGHVREVEKSAEEKNMLLHALAHEMRTPVTAISGYAYALKAAKLDEDMKNEAVSFIESESRRLERLSSRLTELITVNDACPELKEVSVKKLEQQVRQVVTPLAEEAGILLVTEFEEGSVQGDEELLLMLLINLFDNARKAGADRVEISFCKGRLMVSDNGCGIEPEQMEKIMQPFYQGDASRNREGFGLGLALCQRMAGVHGLELQAESTKGEGSRFYLDFGSYKEPEKPLNSND